MQLKKIELQGFKSFADKTEIAFLNGVTTIVGPNGSGKSNISDALRWVLGEQSIKTLRGSKMEDVIFAGTQVRKKVGFAEVSMYLDNTDATLPVEYNEVVVTRRVYRNGESNYLINGSECRLKDIQELFMDTGVGKDGYSIISQGKIDEILSSKSEERRHIFEEAAGIVKYRVRKEEATKKLSNTEINLARVNDILVEIEKNIAPLSQKAEKAKEYLRLKESLKTFDMYLFIESVNKSKEEIKKIDEIVNILSSDIENEEKSTTEIEKNKIDFKNRINQITEQIEATNSSYYEVETALQKINSNIDISNSKIESSNENVKRIKNEIEEENLRIDELSKDVENRIKKREDMEKSKFKFEEELNKKQSELSDITGKLDSKSIEIQKLKSDIDKLQEQRYEIKNDISSMQATIASNRLQIDEKKKNINENISSKDSLILKIDEVVSLLNDKEKYLNKVETELNKSNNELEVSRNELISVNDKKNMLTQDIMTLNSKYNYMKNLENENEGYFKSVKSALDYAKNSRNSSKVFGTIASLINTEEKYEYAIEIALGGYMQNIVVEDEDVATDIVNYLKENSLGRATFLPLNNLKDMNLLGTGKYEKIDGFLGLANDLVKYDKKYKKVVELALNNTIIVEDVKKAIEIFNKMKKSVRIVTLDGELIAPSGSITGGRQKQRNSRTYRKT